MIENMTAKEPLQISSPSMRTITEPLSGDGSREGRDNSPGHDFESKRSSNGKGRRDRKMTTVSRTSSKPVNSAMRQV